jgi:RNA polymerase sigma factor (sigma-70 family)
MAAGRISENEVSDYLSGDPTLHATIRRIARAVVRSFHFRGPTLQEDLVQEIVTRLFVNLSAGSFRGEAALTTYAMQVARYTCLEQIRRRRFVLEVDPTGLPEPELDGGPEASLLRAEHHRHNLKVLAVLPPACRELFRLIFVDELTYAEVGARLGISEVAVKLRVHRCRLTMRSTAAEEHDRPVEANLPPVWTDYQKVKE